MENKQKGLGRAGTEAPQPAPWSLVSGSLHFPLILESGFHGQKNEAHRGKVLSKLVSLPLGVVPILRGKERETSSSSPVSLVLFHRH